MTTNNELLRRLKNLEDNSSERKSTGVKPQAIRQPHVQISDDDKRHRHLLVIGD